MSSSLCISSSVLSSLLGVFPIWDDDTIHATVCCPAESSYVSFIDHPDHDDSEQQIPKKAHKQQTGNKYGSRSIQAHTKSLNVNHKAKKQRNK
jgi:hypothetical protein